MAYYFFGADSSSSDVYMIGWYLQLDRFIPNTSAMDFDYAQYMLMEARKGKENPAVRFPSREAYRKQLAETFNMKRTRILAFKNKPPTPSKAIQIDYLSVAAQQAKPKTRCYIPNVTHHT